MVCVVGQKRIYYTCFIKAQDDIHEKLLMNKTLLSKTDHILRRRTLFIKFHKFVRDDQLTLAVPAVFIFDPIYGEFNETTKSFII